MKTNMEIKPYVQNGKVWFEAILYDKDGRVIAQAAQFGSYTAARDWANDEAEKRRTE